MTEKIKRFVNSILLLGLFCFCSLCFFPYVESSSANTVRTAPRPLWIEVPKSDDSIYMFRIGAATGAASVHQARAEAFENALNVILDEIMARSGISEEDRSALRGRFSIHGVESVPEAVYFEDSASGVSAWIQVSCPLSEKDRLLNEMIEARDALRQAKKEREKFNETMRGLWVEARSSGLKGEHTKALNQLLELEKQYPNIQKPGFEIEEVRLLIGDTYKALKNQLAARASYEAVSGLSTSDVWRTKAVEGLAGLPPPTRFWPMRGRWNAGKVALFCFVREGASSRRFLDLISVLTRDCLDAQMECVDISDKMDLKTIDLVFDKMDFSEVSKIALSNKADVVLAVLFDVDPAKKGTFVEQFGVKMQVPDAVVRFFVIDPHAKSNVFNGQYRDVAGDRPDDVLADRTAVLLITKNLVPHCPSISDNR